MAATPDRERAGPAIGPDVRENAAPAAESEGVLFGAALGGGHRQAVHGADAGGFDGAADGDVATRPKRERLERLNLSSWCC